MTKLPVCVLGAGSFGTALAVLVESNGYPVRLWGRDANALEEIARCRENKRYLPGVEISRHITITEELQVALRGARMILLAVPSRVFRSALRSISRYVETSQCIVWATKGFEPDSGKLLHTVALEELGADCSIGVLSGPTFAGEVARGLPGAVSIAAREQAAAESIAQMFRNDRFRVYASTDLVGVQVGGGVKNVLALAAGIADGLGFGANTRAALITRGLAELTRLGLALGAKSETLMGLSGLGDLVLTCTDDQSRNRRAGLILGGGASVQAALDQIGQVVEGMTAAKEVVRMASALGVDMPISTQVAEVVYNGRTPEQAVRALLARAPSVE